MTYAGLTFAKLNPDAPDIRTGYNNDVGIDLSVVKLIKVENGTAYLGTGWAVQPDAGYYTELHARSSMHKDGVMLANSVGIIDRGYIGEIIVAVQLVPTLAAMLIGGKATTIDEVNKIVGDYIKSLKLPCRWVQLIARKQEASKITTSISLNKTDRGSNGFGSSGK